MRGMGARGQRFKETWDGKRHERKKDGIDEMYEYGTVEEGVRILAVFLSGLVIFSRFFLSSFFFISAQGLFAVFQHTYLVEGIDHEL